MERTLPVIVAICCIATVAYAELKIYETRSLLPVIDAWQVDGVASVDFSSSVSSPSPTFFFDCITTANSGSEIMWRRENLAIELEVYPRGNGSRLELTSGRVTQSRLGEYICEDGATGQSLTLNITDANPAACPVTDVKNAIVGGTVSLDVYAAGVPPVNSTHISWRKDGSSSDLTDAEVDFQNGNKRIVFSNLQLSDAGLYRCAVVLPVAQGVSSTAYAFIELEVDGLSMQSTASIPTAPVSLTASTTAILPSSSSVPLCTPSVGALVPCSCGTTVVLVGGVLGGVLLVVTVILSAIILLLALKLHHHTSQDTFSPGPVTLKEQMNPKVTNSMTHIIGRSTDSL